MENMHLLPTEKPSRLIWYTTGGYHLLKEPIFIDAPLKPSRHIYITSDEEIKEGDYVVQINFEKTNTQVIKCETEFQTKIANSKDGSFSKNKIILTTDQDLINDGVQEINDGFLEWFVKNPSCEFVMTIPDVIGLRDVFQPTGKDLYKIIIPKEEEPKQELRKVCKCKRAYENPLSEICSLCWNELYPNEKDEIKDEDLLEENKQETVEEAAEKYSENWEETTGLDYTKERMVE